MSHVIGAKLQLNALLGEAFLTPHHSSIVDQEVKSGFFCNVTSKMTKTHFHPNPDPFLGTQNKKCFCDRCHSLLLHHFCMVFMVAGIKPDTTLQWLTMS